MKKRRIHTVLICCIWAAVIVLFLIYRDRITIESIVSLAPENTVATSVVLLLLSAVKSITFVDYSGLIYAASGILFPLPYAIFINTLGTIVMTTIPFFIGRKSGGQGIRTLIAKYPKMSILLEIPQKNEVFVSCLVRIIGCLPSDPVGMFLGASGIRYFPYLCGTLIGFAPTIVAFSVMGGNINDVSSPAFIISAVFMVAMIVLSVVLYLIRKAKSRKKPADSKNTE